MRILIIVAALLIYTGSKAQNCSVNFSVDSTSFCQSYVSNSETICQGDTVCITANATLSTVGQAFDFNTNTLPTGWFMSGTPNFGSPCTPSLSGTNYYWSSAATGPSYPHISTASSDVSCGGTINFEMIMGVQGQSAPCDGPDQASEAIHLRYSIDAGAVWIDIEVYTPDIVTNAYTTWECYSVPIPSAAMTTYTMFHWQQDLTPTANFDNWGLDNIVINLNCNQPVIQWSTGLQNASTICDNPTSNQSYIAYVYDDAANFQCQDTFDVIVSSIDLTVIQNDSLLTAQYVNADNYTWLDCDSNYQVIPSANAPSFIAPQAGNYAVQIESLGCIDTSACFSVAFAEQQELALHDFELYPNPSSGGVQIQLNDGSGSSELFIYSSTGDIVLETEFVGNQIMLNLAKVANGIYVIKVRNDNGDIYKRLLLNR